MTSIDVQCPACSLRLVDIEDHPDVTYARDGNGNILCPNDHTPMRPIGERQTMAAEQAFTTAQRELEPPPLPPADTVDTLTKRLHEIERSQSRVMSLKAVHEEAKEEAKDAKKNYDDAIESFLTLTQRMTAVSTPLPLFTAEAEAAAQSGPPMAEIDALTRQLADAGVLIPWDVVNAWTPEQREEAHIWATKEGTVESMPEFVAEAATEPEPATTTA